jgi:ubiquinone/menaquinone biosynthesis C-methylase UbiE
MSDPSLYDEVVYPGRAFPQTHPNRLATMATLFGLDAADPAGCRLLELGCGDGGNLLPMALSLPGASFVGIDNSAQAIARARSVAQETGIANVRFELLGVEEYEPDAGGFDYVVAHGLYSWVPAPLRDRILDLFAAALAPQGVAFVSYNVRPGHNPRQALREMLLFALRGIDEPQAKMAAGRKLLEEVCEVWPGGEGLETTLGGQARMLLAQGDALFFHDTLAPVNHAPYFHEFAADAAEHGLRFLAEAEFAEMQTGGLPEELRVRMITLDDVVQREQLIDFLRQRMFRQTLLCHADAPVDPVPHPRRAATLAAAGAIDVSLDAETGRTTFSAGDGARVTTDHPVLVDALGRIAESWPAAVPVAELASDDDESSDARLVMLCESLLACFAAKLLRLHAHPPELAVRPGSRPRVSPLARLQARERDYVTTLWHTSIRLEDDLGWQLLTLLDGTRDRAALLAALKKGMKGGYRHLARDLDRSLSTLGRAALLMPED